MGHNLSFLVFGIPPQKRKGIPSGFEEMPFCFFRDQTLCDGDVNR